MTAPNQSPTEAEKVPQISHETAIRGDAASTPTPPNADCLICDLYTAIDTHGDPSTDFVAALVTTLPPRGHAFHRIANRVCGTCKQPITTLGQPCPGPPDGDAA